MNSNNSDKFMSDLTYKLENIEIDENDLISKFEKMNIKKKEKIINFHLISLSGKYSPINFNAKKIRYKKHISHIIMDLVQYNWNYTTVLPFNIPINKKTLKKMVIDFTHPSVNGDVIFGENEGELEVSKIIQSDKFCVNIINKLNIKKNENNFIIYSVFICLFDKLSEPENDIKQSTSVKKKFTLLSNIDYKLNSEVPNDNPFIRLNKVNLIVGILSNHNNLNDYNFNFPVILKSKRYSKINITGIAKLVSVLHRLSQVYPLVNILKC